MRQLLPSGLLCGLLIVACQPAERDLFESGGVQSTSGDGTVGGSDGGSSDGGTSDGGSSDEGGTGTVATDGGDGDGDGSSGGIRLDVAPGDTAGGDGPGGMGCEKVDFLFVIDNSLSMGVAQNALVASFPGFIDEIQAELAGQDYHIMVVDSDGTGAACDTALGAGRTVSDVGDPCGVDTADRYLRHTQSDLHGTFQCIAKVGTGGSGNEQVMTAMVEALSEGQTVGGCNDGFLRPDALLVLTVVSDAPPLTSAEQGPGLPQDWYDAVVAAKGGDPSRVTTLGLVSDGHEMTGLCNCPRMDGSGCSPDADEGSPKYQEFVTLFPSHVLASVCAADFTGFFAQAVGTVDKACDDFVPPG